MTTWKGFLFSLALCSTLCVFAAGGNSELETLPRNTVTGKEVFVPESLFDEAIYGSTQQGLSSARVSEIGAKIDSLVQTWKVFRPIHEKNNTIIDGCYQVSKYVHGHRAELIRIGRSEPTTLAELSSRAEIVLAGKIIDKRDGLLFGSFGSLLTVETSRLLQGSLQEKPTAFVTADWYDLLVDGDRICEKYLDSDLPTIGDSVLVLASVVKDTQPQLLAPHILFKISDGRILSQGIPFLSGPSSSSVEELSVGLESLKEKASHQGRPE